MIGEQEQDLTGVVCLHCGMHTALSALSGKGPSNGITTAKLNPYLSIVRCHECGKEAPYLAGDIVVFKGTLNNKRSVA